MGWEYVRVQCPGKIYIRHCDKYLEFVVLVDEDPLPFNARKISEIRFSRKQVFACNEDEVGAIAKLIELPLSIISSIYADIEVSPCFKLIHPVLPGETRTLVRIIV